MVVIPSKMRGLNRRALFERLRHRGRATRADLARLVGMSPPTAGKIVDELLAAGVIEEIEDSHRVAAASPAATSPDGRLGRPGRLLQLDRRQPRFLGIELSVSETRLAALPVGASAADCWEVTVPTLQSARSWVGQLTVAARQFPRRRFWGVLVSVPGIVDEPAGQVLFSPNLHWTERADLRGLVREVWDAPVELVQEERALALGHQLAEPSGDDFLLVDTGEGVGGAAVLGGKVYHSTLPISGELGHTPVRGNRRRCGCGAVGCVETLVSLPGLLRSHVEARPGRSRSWPALVRHVGQDGILTWLAEALDALGAVIAGAINVLGLKRVVVTGSLTELPPTVMTHLSGAVNRGAMWARFGQVVCQSACRRRAAGLVAAGLDRLVIPAHEVGLAPASVEYRSRQERRTFIP